MITGDIHGHVVVANGERHPISLHIPKVYEPVAENIESLLTWRSRIPKRPYGRESEFAELRRWCDESAAIRIRVLCGDGGAGKSRLAFELAETLRDAGWQAGQLVDPAQPVAFPICEPGVLLIIDYPEQFSAALERLLHVIKNSELPGVRLRLLLLSRNRDAMQKLIDRHVEPLRSPTLELRPLQSEAVSWALFQDGWQQMAKLRGVTAALPIDNAAFRAWFERDPAHAQPLMLLSFALNLLYDPHATQLGRAEILQRLAQRERDRLREEAKQHDLQAEGVELLKALAAIPGSWTAPSIDALTTKLSHPGIRLPTAIELQRTSLWRQEGLCEMQPDLLASVLIHAVINDRFPDPPTAGRWIWLALTMDDPTRETFRGRLRRIGRLTTDRPRSATQEPSPNPIVAALAHLVSEDDRKAKCIAAALQRDWLEWTLKPLVLSAVRKLVESYEHLTQENFATHSPILALGLNHLSLCLADSGDHAGALAASQRSLEIYELLAREDFAAYAPALASCLSNLSLRLSEANDQTGSLAAIRRSVDIFEQLSRENYAAHAPELARCLNNLSIELEELGDRPGGLATIRRAVEIREQLARENFAAHAADLAVSLDNLSIRLSKSGDHAGGLAASRRSLEIYERLARDHFAAYAPYLANCLNNFSSNLAHSGDHAGGLAMSRRAVEILEWLALEDFTAYAPALANSLINLSRRLAESRDNTGGLAAIRRSSEIYEHLARENFAVHAPGLARSLGHMSARLFESGDNAGALSTGQRSVQIYEQLVRENFAAHAPYLGRALNNLSAYLYKSGDRAQAISALERAMELTRPFATPEAEAHIVYESMQRNSRKMTDGRN